MTILSTDIVLFQSQDNTDNDSGGGSRTSNEVIDGQVNNLFPDISRLDTVVGRVNLRKVFPTVTTVNNDVYYGAHSMIRKVPDDPKVSALLFYTDDPHDRRVDAQNKIESYVVQSYLAQFYLYGVHIAGGKSITVLQQLSAQLPVVGDVYLIKEGSTEQYVRLIEITATEVNIPYSFGNSLVDYVRRRIDCEIDQVLETAFTGSAFVPTGQIAGTADIWETQVADAAKFYSTKTLEVEGLVSDSTVTVDSIYEQLVPAALSKSFLTDRQALPEGILLMPSGVVNTSYRVPVDVAANDPIVFPTAIVPNSLTTILTAAWHDDGNGNIIDDNAGGAIIGSVDYSQGIVFMFNVIISAAYTLHYEPATTSNVSIQSTTEIEITQGNTGTFFTRRISPSPSLGSLFIDYRTQGKWYRLVSTGNRIGDNETVGFDVDIGAGNLKDNFDGTSSLTLTLASLPDLDTSIILSWGTIETTINHVTTVQTYSDGYMQIDLGQIDIDPLTFVMQLHSTTFSTYYNVTADADGNLIDAISASYAVKGKLNYRSGIVNIYPFNDGVTPTNQGRFDDPGTIDDVIIDFDNYAPASELLGAWSTVVITNATELSNVITFNIGESVIVDSVEISFFMDFPIFTGAVFKEKGQTVKMTLLTDTNGDISMEAIDVVGLKTNRMTGTVAANGDVVINLINKDYNKYNPGWLGYFGNSPKFLLSVTDYYQLGGNDITVKYKSVNINPADAKTSHNITDKIENLAKYRIHIPTDILGEVNFSFGELNNNVTTVTSKLGVLFANGNNVGTIDYNGGVIELDYFSSPKSGWIQFITIFTDTVTTGQADPIESAVFRTSATKLTPSSLQLVYRDYDENLLTATTDGNGIITGTSILAGSKVDTITGKVTVLFDDLMIANSIRYDAIAEVALPLDPELLGLNPVRLPADGRVPVFKAGYFIIIFNEVTTAVINGGVPVADQINTLARSGQAYIEVIDVDGKRLDPLQYVADRVLGTVTFANPFTPIDKYGDPLTAPFSIVDRIEDLRLATDVQINGLITLNEPLSQAFSAGVSKVASALIWGDTGARVYQLFSQEIWNSGSPVWSDERIGDPTTAQYDDTNYPIYIDNNSSSSGRWAIIFTSPTTVNVANEKLGFVDTSISISIDDVAPINPATLAPYFIMPKEGFGSGWIQDNVIRFNTDSGENNMWVIRTIESGALSELTDSIDVEVRGDAN